MTADGAGAPLAALLRDRRQAAGLSRRELARRTGLSVGAVRDLEQGRRRPRASSLRLLAAALDMDTAELGGPAVAGMPRPATAQQHSGLWLRMLGPVAAWHGDHALDLGAARQRAVLAVLALEPGRLVSRAAIIDAVWGAAPPRSAVNLTQTYVSRLRRALAPAGGPLVSAPGGYRLELTAGHLDLLSFRELAAAGQFAEALELWHGDPVADLAALHGYPPVTALSEERSAAVLGYAEACERLGRPADALAALRAAADRRPLDERLQARLITALAAAGRQADALGVYEDLRRRLDAELGVSPGPELAEAHLRVLRGQVPSTGSAAAGPAATAGPAAVPRLLPRPVPGFAGRAGPLAALSAALDDADAAGAPLPVWVISGPAGVGKSTLALHWAHQVAGRFPDGQLYMDLRGFSPAGPPASTREVITGLLEMLQAPARQLPASPEAQLGLYRSLLAGKRALLVLDNARDAEQVRGMLPAGPGCLVVVTSRDRLPGLAASHAARLLTLDVFTPAEARELLVRRLPGGGRPDAEPDAAARIIALCARLPLALAIAVARARPGWTLAALADDLGGTPARLDALDTGDAAASVRAVFSWSYHGLDPATARVFRLLGLHNGPDISPAAVASLAGISRAEAGAALHHLARLHMLAEPAPGRFVMHELLRAYAAEQARGRDSEDSRQVALHRVLDHYLHTASAAARELHPYRTQVALRPPQPGAQPEQLSGRDQALAWFQAERKVLLGAVSQAAGTGFVTHAWQLPWAAATFFNWQGYWHELAATQEAALAATRHLGDLEGQAQAQHYLAQAWMRLGGFAEAAGHLTEALALGGRLGSLVIQARAHIDLGHVLDLQGRSRDAIGHARQALELYRAAGHRAGQADALNAIGWCHARLGQHEPALDYSTQALAIYRELGNRPAQAATLDSVGFAQHHLGRHAAAIDSYRQAIEVHGDAADRHLRAEMLTHLGDAHRASGDDDAARRDWRKALEILDELRHPDAEQVRSRLA